MDVCVNACERQGENNGSIAESIKVTLDSRYTTYGGPAAWHVIVGESYGFEVVYEVTNIMYMFFSANLAICVWKC